MNYRRTFFVSSLLLFAAVTGWAVAEPTAEELEQNRRKLEAWRKDADHLNRLRHDLQSFLNLPADRREKIIKLDADLRQENPKKQTQLWNVLDRYAGWLDRLDEKDRQEIRQAPTKEARLALIRDLREQLWMRSQPDADRKKWKNLKGEARNEFVKKLRRESRDRRQDWQFAARFWHELQGKKVMPCRLSEYTPKVQTYVNEYLMVMITDAEKKALTDAEGAWPRYPKKLVEIASKHPSALPVGLAPSFSKLPLPIQKASGGKGKILKILEKTEGKRELFTKVVELGTKQGQQPFDHEFLACNYKSLQPAMQSFVDHKLKAAIKDNQDALERLRLSSGKWPDYPETIEALAERYHLQPPWHILPDVDKYRWDEYRPSKTAPAQVRQ